MSLCAFSEVTHNFPGEYISLEKNQYNCGLNLVIEQNSRKDTLRIIKNLSKDHFEVDSIDIAPHSSVSRGFKLEYSISEKEIVKITSKENLMGRFKVRRILTLKLRTNRNSQITVLHLKVKNKNKTITHNCLYSKI